MKDCEIPDNTSSLESYRHTQRLRNEFDGSEESFLEIVRVSNWSWFIDYYNNPKEPLVTDKTLNGWRELSHFETFNVPDLKDWVVVNWDNSMIEKLVLEERIDITYGEHPILEAIYEKTKDPFCIELSEKIGYVREFPKQTELTTAISEKYGKFPVKKYYHYVSKYNSERIRDYSNKNANKFKEQIGICFGFPKFTKKKQFEYFSDWICNNVSYSVGDVLSIDIGTEWANLKSYDSEKERAHKIKNAKFTSMGYHFIGTNEVGIIYDLEKIQKIISRAKLIITFNGFRFDSIVLKNNGIDIEKNHYDVYDCIVRHKRINKSLNDYTELNGLIKKQMGNAMVDARRLSSLFYLLTTLGMKITENESIKTSLTEGINKIPEPINYGSRGNACYDFLQSEGITISHE
jgi:uncharacterized protein YprB with RNaseH-like and TPR domain|tara:strand:+ start:1582 stop:2793 length:1212 start_codon:yes stop_codon:yes gene_type:complete